MNANEWITLLGVAVSAAVVIGPGIVTLHAKLAVVATQVAELCDNVEKLSSLHIRSRSSCEEESFSTLSQVAELCDKVEKLSSSHEERLRMCIDHQSRLDTQEVQIADVIERLRDMEN